MEVQTPDGPSLTGRITGADDDGVDLDVDGVTHRLAYTDVTNARVQVEFARKEG